MPRLSVCTYVSCGPNIVSIQMRQIGTRAPVCPVNLYGLVNTMSLPSRSEVLGSDLAQRSSVAGESSGAPDEVCPVNRYEQTSRSWTRRSERHVRLIGMNGCSLWP